MRDDFHAAVVGCALAVVYRELRRLAVQTSAAKEQETTDKDNAKENKNQEGDQQVDCSFRQSAIVLLSRKKSVRFLHHGGGGVVVVSDSDASRRI